MTQKEIKKFYDTHYRRLFNASYRIVGNGADAEAIMHDTLLRFLQMETPVALRLRLKCLVFVEIQ